MAVFHAIENDRSDFLAGNSMHLANASIVLLIGLCCFSPRVQPDYNSDFVWAQKQLCSLQLFFVPFAGWFKWMFDCLVWCCLHILVDWLKCLTTVARTSISSNPPSIRWFGDECMIVKATSGPISLNGCSLPVIVSWWLSALRLSIRKLQGLLCHPLTLGLV